jgi:hypothetical protein
MASIKPGYMSKLPVELKHIIQQYSYSPISRSLAQDIMSFHSTNIILNEYYSTITSYARADELLRFSLCISPGTVINKIHIFHLKNKLKKHNRITIGDIRRIWASLTPYYRNRFIQRCIYGVYYDDNPSYNY